MRRWRRAWALSVPIVLGASAICGQTPPVVSGSPAPPARPALPAQTDPVVGNWRGTLKNAQDVDSPIIITIAKKGDGYAGTTKVTSNTAFEITEEISVDGSAFKRLGKARYTRTQ
jgi:hypothetical protein